MDEKILRIVERIGRENAQDYILNPEEHHRLYKQDLPELAAVLSSTEVEVMAQEYQSHDQKALAAQQKYKTYSARARWFTLLTAVFTSLLVMFGGLLLLFGVPEPDQEFISKYAIITLSVLGVICSVLAGVHINLIRDRELLEKWMVERSRAEEFRLNYFDTITSLPSESPASDQVLARLEYFRRYQLEIQLNYYTNRSKQLEKRANLLLTSAAWIMGGVALTDGLVGVLGGGEVGWTALAGVALIIQAVGNLIHNRELTEQNQRNAVRYDNTRALLIKLYGRLDEIRNGILKGNQGLLAKYVEAVHEPLSNENRQWLETMSQKHSAIGRLEEELGDLEKNMQIGTS